MRTLAACIVLSLVPSIALADVVDPEPESCPPGSTPSTAHSGPYCAPTTECSADSECSAGTCMQVMQCIETRECGGLSFPDAAPCTLEHVVGPCSGDGTCAVGECRARRVCSTGSTSDGGCGCSMVGSGSSRAVPIALLALAIVLASTRRETRR